MQRIMQHHARIKQTLIQIQLANIMEIHPTIIYKHTNHLKIMQQSYKYHAKPCKTMHNHVKLCKTHAHSMLILKITPLRQRTRENSSWETTGDNGRQRGTTKIPAYAY